jgi:hypothetical protein
VAQNIIKPHIAVETAIKHMAWMEIARDIMERKDK